jgi:hypothetical protein
MMNSLRIIIYFFKAIDFVLRKFNRCLVLDVDTTNERYEVKNIFIDKVL